MHDAYGCLRKSFTHSKGGFIWRRGNKSTLFNEIITLVTFLRTFYEVVFFYAVPQCMKNGHFWKRGQVSKIHDFSAAT